MNELREHVTLSDLACGSNLPSAILSTGSLIHVRKIVQ
jgi:hypothetical protein